MCELSGTQNPMDNAIQFDIAEYLHTKAVSHGIYQIALFM